ncbi:MAG TPA: M36 family metallopeptidase, partial [bacterium]|nr:M36 family metallopeptidase [bacterium]
MSAARLRAGLLLAGAVVLGAPLARAFSAAPGLGLPPAPRVPSVASDGPGEEALAPAARRDLAKLPGWRALASQGVAHRLFGPALGVPATDPSGVASDADLAAFGRDFLDRHAALLGIDGVELAARAPVRSGRFAFLLYDQRLRGIPVEDARVELTLADGALVAARAEIADMGGAVSTGPSLPPAAAESAAERAVLERGSVPIGAAVVDASRPLAIVPDGARWRLAWRVRVDADPAARLTLWVDAQDGRVLATRDALLHATGVDVVGSFEPRRVGDPLATAGFGFIDVRAEGQTVAADTAGHAVVPAPSGPSEAFAYFDGSFIREALFGTSSVSSAGVALVAGTTETVSFSDANSLLAERDLYHSRLVVHARHKAMAPDIAWVDSPLLYELEIIDSQGCNAFWDSVAGQVNLYAESATCNDVARVADVVYHETTHGLHQALSSGGFIASDLAEGSADYVAATINDDPEIGPTFFKATGEGIRNFEPAKVYPQDMTGEPHHDGLIWGGSFWDLRNTLAVEEGYDAGVARADRLLADTLRADPTLVDGFWDVLVADDDDGNLANGTPHLCEIVDAFAAHG